VIYASEFILWCGIFACGGYYNLIPWVKARIHLRKGRRVQHIDRIERIGEEDITASSNRVQLHDLPSSTSVFRTPSSVIRRYPEREIDCR